MVAHQRIKYLKIDRGRFYYQRRIPQRLREILGNSMWQMPCGDVPFDKAVQLVVTWAEEHDELIAKLDTNDGLREHLTAGRRSEEIAFEQSLKNPNCWSLYEDESGETLPLDEIQRPWLNADIGITELDIRRANKNAPKWEVNQLTAAIRRAELDGSSLGIVTLPPYPEFKEIAIKFAVSTAVDRFQFTKELYEGMFDEEYLDELLKLQKNFIPKDRRPPVDPDDRDKFDFVKRRLERKIASVAPDPNTISAVGERYFLFNSIREQTRLKYRRELNRLIEITGDVPISHVQSSDLRQLRDLLTKKIKPASVQAVFTPIKGLFSFALEEELVSSSPMSGVKLPRDKRPIEQRKWRKFDPIEMRQILSSAEAVWTEPCRNLTVERRTAIHMVVRVLTYTGMRPIEVLRLTSVDIEDHLIRIHDSKTDSSTRVIPLHPEISDFPDWLRNGGLRTFDSIHSDRVGSVRHNFGQLIRQKLPNPILDPQKALYSLRSTFVNAMRRAGADIQMQRAILGHKEAGAIRHYDDGPEFEEKRKWVLATDPLQ